MLFTMWFVATPACVVERLGPFDSMARSSQLTKGHRGKVFGLFIVLTLVGAIVSSLIDFVLEDVVQSATLALVGSLLWNGIWGAFYAIAAVVTYHDTDIEQIAAVFDNGTRGQAACAPLRPETQGLRRIALDMIASRIPRWPRPTFGAKDPNRGRHTTDTTARFAAHSASARCSAAPRRCVAKPPDLLRRHGGRQSSRRCC
jgi:MFS family permease